MLHREASIAARLANTGMVPMEHDDLDKRRLQATSKMRYVEQKARKKAGLTSVYGVYDTTEKQKRKRYCENANRNLADRDGYKLSGELSAAQKKARLFTRKVPRIPDDVGDAHEGLVQKNELSTYEELLQSEWNHSVYCSSARAGRLANVTRAKSTSTRISSRLSTGSKVSIGLKRGGERRRQLTALLLRRMQ
jgi:hypothetical protein